MFHNKDEAFAHWKKFILSCMESKNLGIDDKLGFVKALSLFDSDAALISASNIATADQREKQQVEELVSKIQKHEKLAF